MSESKVRLRKEKFRRDSENKIQLHFKQEERKKKTIPSEKRKNQNGSNDILPRQTSIINSQCTHKENILNNTPILDTCQIKAHRHTDAKPLPLRIRKKGTGFSPGHAGGIRKREREGGQGEGKEGWRDGGRTKCRHLHKLPPSPSNNEIMRR